MTRLRRMSPAVVVILGAGAVLAAALWPGPDRRGEASEQPARQRLPQPLVDTHDLMELFNQPLYEFLKETMEEQPTTQEQWDTVRERGLQAAEVANLVAIRENAAKMPEWTERSAALQRAGLALAEAGKNENWQAAQSAYRNLIQSCNDCHQNVAPNEAPMLRP